MADQTPPQSSMLLYQTEDGRTRVQCRFENESIWLTQALIAELFQKDVRTINEHLVNILEEGELTSDATIRKFRIVHRGRPRRLRAALSGMPAGCVSIRDTHVRVVVTGRRRGPRCFPRRDRRRRAVPTRPVRRAAVAARHRRQPCAPLATSSNPATAADGGHE